VAFITDHAPVKTEVPLVCPKPTSPQEHPLSPFDDDGDKDNSCNAGDPTLSDASDSEEDNSTDENEDDDDEDGYVLGGPVVSESDVNESPDIELRDILDSLGDVLDCNLDESETSNYQKYIGVAEDSTYHHTIDLMASLTKPKRVLSYNTLFALNREAGHNSDATKRFKRDDLKDMPSPAPTTLFTTLFSLGPPAIQSLPPIRDESPVISDDDDAELDRQLGSELDEQDITEDHDERPVPLLTPPASPLTIEVNGGHTTICEWPSNLTVESAMQAVNELRPLSPASFATLERDEECMSFRIDNNASEATTLTPLLRSVYVGS